MVTMLSFIWKEVNREQYIYIYTCNFPLLEGSQTALIFKKRKQAAHLRLKIKPKIEETAKK